MANGAKCSVGDQMHPDGYMDEATYDLIGAAYAEVEAKEPWLDGVTSVADIAVLSEEAVANYYADRSFTAASADTGAIRMLLEGKFLFDMIDVEELVKGIGRYKLLILPDNIRLDETMTSAVKAFTAEGGRVLATGISGTDAAERFALALGAKFLGESKFKPVYFRPRFALDSLGNSAFVIYRQAYDIEADNDAAVVIDRENPYFNRTTFAFSSHQHTPNDKSVRLPAATIGEDGAYISAKIFTEYATTGSLIAKSLTHHIINLLLGEEKTLVTNLPSLGVVTLKKQVAENRLVNHLLYATPVKRGGGIEVIEDIVPLYGVEVSVRWDCAPKRVYTAPAMADLPYTYENGRISYTIDRLSLHTMVVMEL